MSYIGNSPGVASQRVTTTLTATASQTVFTTQSGYVLGYVDVYLNGVKLVNGADFEAISGTYVSLFTGALVGDVVELVSYIPRGLSDGYTKSEADAKFLDVGGDTASGTINLGTNGLVVGTNQLVASGGNVGIGTATPAAELEVSTSTGSATPTATEIRISSTTSGSDWNSTLPWARLGFYSADSSASGPKTHAAIDAIMNGTTGGSSNLAFSTYNTATSTFSEKLRIQSTGDVGIGTISPSGKFEVSGGRSWFTSNNEVYSIAMRYSASTGVMYMGATNSLAAPSIQFSNTAGSALATIDYNGNVGIGIAPTRKLDVVGSARFMQDNAATTGAITLRQNVGDTVGSYIQWVTNANTAEKGWLLVDTNSNMVFATASAEKMRITTTGDIGIGTLTPQAKLHIGNGWIGLHSNISTSTAVPTWTAARITGEIHGADNVGSGSDGGLLRLSAGGESASNQKAGIDISGYNTTDGGSTLRFYTGGERLRITTGGKVLINNTNVGGLGVLNVCAQTALAGTNTYYAQTLSGSGYADTGSHTTMLGFSVEPSASWNKGAIGYTRTGSYDTGYLAFYLNNAADVSTCALANERMRIDNNGRVSIGSISQLYSATLTLKSAGNSYNLTSSRVGAGTGSLGHIVFESDSGAVGTIFTGGSSTSYNTTSDYRLKENVTPMSNALAFVRKQRPVNYSWKIDGTPGAGYIAHWLQEDGADQCVTGIKDAIDAEGNPQYQSIDTSFMVAPLNAALKELADIVDAQAVLINQLTTRLTALENK